MALRSWFVGESQRAFYDQFDNTFPIIAHYGLLLWSRKSGPDRPGQRVP